MPCTPGLQDSKCSGPPPRKYPVNHTIIFLIGFFTGLVATVFLFVGIVLITGSLRQKTEGNEVQYVEKTSDPQITLQTLGLWVLGHLAITAGLIGLQEIVRRRKSK
ncbi:uncharacterized protein DEA37_0000751 [Paragonimus westermani]|uniref:Uncharacterized protein n=1 Tax=Paragonimus westermani TaxID=34504 RepID=A0A5J4NI29_9TREM|nr:uncharacterized protein DEA37_0000751 [Paragonimus westermani]